MVLTYGVYSILPINSGQPKLGGDQNNVYISVLRLENALRQPLISADRFLLKRIGSKMDVRTYILRME